MIDMTKLQAEVNAEIQDELLKKYKGKLKGSLSAIAAAERIVRNLKREHEAMLLELTDAAS